MAPTPDAMKSNSMSPWPKRSVCSTGFGERNSAQMRIARIVKPIPVRIAGIGHAQSRNAQNATMTTVMRWHAERTSCRISVAREGDAGDTGEAGVSEVTPGVYPGSASRSP